MADFSLPSGPFMKLARPVVFVEKPRLKSVAHGIEPYMGAY